MTKERKVAIEMWENIVADLSNTNVESLKKMYMDLVPYEWQNNCWFCEYCRKDYRWGHVGREELDHELNKCKSCPLYKYEIARCNTPIVKDACGCANSDWDYEVLWGKVYYNRDVDAAKIILRILKGEKIENLL